MANEEQVNILLQGAEVWNVWREDNRSVKIDLRGAFLLTANLGKFNLMDADLVEADLVGANFRYANLKNANLSSADLRRAYLEGTKLDGANLSYADLQKANLRDCTLIETKLHMTNLIETSFYHALLAETIFSSTDLSTALDLESVQHMNSSIISAATIKLSGGNIPVRFLQGCGLSDWEIESALLYKPNLSNEEIDQILTFIVVIPALCLCLGILGIIPLSSFFNSLLQF